VHAHTEGTQNGSPNLNSFEPLFWRDAWEEGEEWIEHQILSLEWFGPDVVRSSGHLVGLGTMVLKARGGTIERHCLYSRLGSVVDGVS
jgi:hypothetical protein